MLPFRQLKSVHVCSARRDGVVGFVVSGHGGLRPWSQRLRPPLFAAEVEAPPPALPSEVEAMHNIQMHNIGSQTKRIAAISTIVPTRDA